MATEILKKQTIVGTDAQYEANKNSYEEGTVFESTSLLGEGDIDPTYTNKFVQKRTTTGGVKLYAYDSTGDVYQDADTGIGAYSIARRGAGGVLKVGTPVEQSDATTKKYVDDRFVTKTTTTSGYNLAYVAINNGTQGTMGIANDVAPGTLAQRGAGGVLKVGTPVGVSDATTKKYVDDSISNSKISAINLTKGITSVSHDPAKGILMNGTSELTLEDGTKKDATMNIEVPIVGGDYVDITKYDGDDRLYIELNPLAIVDAALGTSPGPQVLAIGPSGTEYYELGQLAPAAIAQYTGDAKLQAVTDDEEITDPDTDAVLVNKAYANKHYVAKQTTTADGTYVYTYNKHGGASLPADVRSLEGTVAVRFSGGTLAVGTPVTDNDAATKAYVDSKKTYTHYIHMQRRDPTHRDFAEVFMNISGSSIGGPVYDLPALTALIEDVFPGPYYASATGWDAANGSYIIGTAIDFGTGDLCFMEMNGAYVTVTDDFMYDDNVK